MRGVGGGGLSFAPLIEGTSREFLDLFWSLCGENSSATLLVVCMTPGSTFSHISRMCRPTQQSFFGGGSRALSGFMSRANSPEAFRRHATCVNVPAASFSFVVAAPETVYRCFPSDLWQPLPLPRLFPSWKPLRNGLASGELLETDCKPLKGDLWIVMKEPGNISIFEGENEKTSPEKFAGDPFESCAGICLNPWEGLCMVQSVVLFFR